MQWPWKRAVVISTFEEPERQRAFSLQAQQLGIKPEFWIGHRNEQDPVAGCRAAHQSVMWSIVRSKETTVVFEDDAVFHPNFEDGLVGLLLNVPNDFDALWLGGCHLERPIAHPGYDQCVRVARTHAYIVRPHTASMLLHAKVTGIPALCHVDAMWSDTLTPLGKTFAPRGWLVGQSAGYSAVTKSTKPERWR